MARQREKQKRLVSMSTLVDDSLPLLAYGLRTSGVAVSLDVPADLPPILCDPDQIQQVLSKLLVNARQALEEQPQPRSIHIAAGAEGAG